MKRKNKMPPRECPHCGSSKIDMPTSLEINDSEIICSGRCADCGYKWREVYRFVYWSTLPNEMP